MRSRAKSGADAPPYEHGCVRRLFPEPEDNSVRIWRFMDFTRYVAILENGGLFFTRCDHLDDQFEGSITSATRDALMERFRREGLSSDGLEKLASSLAALNRWFRQWTMLNCWHINEHESAAMWRLYSQTKEAVALASSYERLRSCLSDDFWIEQVQYIDYSTDVIPDGNAMYPFVFKRKSFSHERELRAFTVDLPTKGNHFDTDATPDSDGVWVKLDLNVLVEAVYVAPRAPAWFSELVSRVSPRYGIRTPVRQSSLDRDPIY